MSPHPAHLGLNGARSLRGALLTALAGGTLAFPGGGTPRDEELARTKRELARVTKERDFLKDAAA